MRTFNVAAFSAGAMFIIVHDIQLKSTSVSLAGSCFKVQQVLLRSGIMCVFDDKYLHLAAGAFFNWGYVWCTCSVSLKRCPALGSDLPSCDCRPSQLCCYSLEYVLKLIHRDRPSVDYSCGLRTFWIRKHASPSATPPPPRFLVPVCLFADVLGHRLAVHWSRCPRDKPKK